MRTRTLCCHWSGVGSPGSRAKSLCTCQVLRPRRAVQALALPCPYLLPSAFATASTQWLAYALPYRRFAAVLTDCDARLGADMDRYPFIVSDLQRLLVAGLPAHCERFRTSSCQSTARFEIAVRNRYLPSVLPVSRRATRI